MRVFGHDWLKVDDEIVRDLQSLQRESAIYVDHWQESLNDFRHVQIKFTPAEVKEYVRSYWAYELFLRAGSPSSAGGVAGIPPDIAKRADAYVMRTVHGKTFGPPYHCPAGFLGEQLEELVCTNVRSTTLEEVGTQALITTVKRAIDSLTPSIRLFNRREKGLAPWPVQREDDVRDLLYAVLRASISDLRREEAVPSKGGTHKFADLCSPVARVLIEVKWVAKLGTWKKFAKEINDDIQCYIRHPACATLIFVILDAAKDIPDPALLESEISRFQTIEGKVVQVIAFVREP